MLLPDISPSQAGDVVPVFRNGQPTPLQRITLSTPLETVAAQAAAGVLSQIDQIVDGQGAVIPTGIVGRRVITFPCTINSAWLLADQIGNVVVDLWKQTFASYPPTDANSIVASDPPTLSAAATFKDTTLTGWALTFLPGDVLFYNIDSVATIKYLTISLGITKT